MSSTNTEVTRHEQVKAVLVGAESAGRITRLEPIVYVRPGSKVPGSSARVLDRWEGNLIGIVDYWVALTEGPLPDDEVNRLANEIFGQLPEGARRQRAYSDIPVVNRRRITPAKMTLVNDAAGYVQHNTKFHPNRYLANEGIQLPGASLPQTPQYFDTKTSVLVVPDARMMVAVLGIKSNERIDVVPYTPPRIDS